MASPKVSPRLVFLQIDPPLLQYKSWYDAEGCSAIGPLDRFRAFGNLGAESAGMRHDPDSPKIQPVGIPTSLDGHIGMIAFERVAFTGSVEPAEFAILQIKDAAPQLGRQLGSP